MRPLTGGHVGGRLRGGVQMSISKIRSLLYKTARLFGDVEAARKGRLGERLVRRYTGRMASRLMRKINK